MHILALRYYVSAMKYTSWRQNKAFRREDLFFNAEIYYSTDAIMYFGAKLQYFDANIFP